MQPIALDILGIPVRLASPERWPLLVLVALACLLLIRQVIVRRRLLDRLAPERELRQAIVPGARVGIAPAICAGVGLLLVALALLQPQLGQRNERVQRRGIDLVVAIDASRSMLARDVLPSRLERARLELSALIDGLAGDRVGLVVFAGQAFVQCPLTSDYGAARLFLRAIDPDSMPTQGTAVADALRTAGSMLRAADRGAKTRAVLLITDGEDHEGDALDAARALRDEGVRVFALGVGSAAGSPVPILDEQGQVRGYLRDRSGEPVVSRLEEEQLRQIASITDGAYVAGRGGDLGMGEIHAALQRLEKSEFESHLAVRWGDVWHWLGFPAFAALLLGALWPERRWRR